jgi:hypothetical protein
MIPFPGISCAFGVGQFNAEGAEDRREFAENRRIPLRTLFSNSASSALNWFLCPAHEIQGNGITASDQVGHKKNFIRSLTTEGDMRDRVPEEIARNPQPHAPGGKESESPPE